MSPIIFHNLFDDDESDQETESVREVAIPVLYSVEELFNMMADFNTAAAVLDDDDEDTEEIIKMEEDLAKTENIENNKPAKKLKPSRPLKHKNVKTETSKSQSVEEFKEESSNVKEEVSDLSLHNSGTRKVTLKMGTRHVVPAVTAQVVIDEVTTDDDDAMNSSLGILLANKDSKLETVKTSGKVKHGQSNNVMVTPCQQKDEVKTVEPPSSIKQSSKTEKKPKALHAGKVKKEQEVLKTEKLSLPSTVRVTLVKEEFTTASKIATEENSSDVLEASKILEDKISEKDKLIFAQQKTIKEFVLKNEEVDQKLALREEFIDSQQKVLDELEKQTINVHIVEKLEFDLLNKDKISSNLEADLKEKDKVIFKLSQSEEVLKNKLKNESEKTSKTQQKLLEDLKKQFLMVKSDNLLKSTENKQLLDKFNALEKEKDAIVQFVNSNKSSYDDILKTVEALKFRIDEVRFSESSADEQLVKIENLEEEISMLKSLLQELELKDKSMELKLSNNSEENNLLEITLNEKSMTIKKLDKELLKLSEKVKDLQKNCDIKSSKLSRLEKERKEHREKFKDLEKDMDTKCKELITLKSRLDEKNSKASATDKEIEQSKSKLEELENRLNIETEKSVELIKKVNFSEKLLFTKESDYLALKDQLVLSECKLRTSQKKVEEYEKDNFKFVEANLKVKCLEDEKQDLLKEIRKVSELQKKVKFLESKLKKYYNFYKEQTLQTEEEEFDSRIKPTSLEGIDIPDPKEIDEILKQISQDVTKHTELVASESTIQDLPEPTHKNTEQDSYITNLKVDHKVTDLTDNFDLLEEKDHSEQSKIVPNLEEEDGLLNAWRSRMKQTQFSGYPASSSTNLEDFASYSPKHTDNSMVKEQSSSKMNMGSKDPTVEVEDIVVISSHEFRSSKSSNKKYISSESDGESQNDEHGRKHKSKKSKKKKKKYKIKKDEKDNDKGRERKKHRSRRKSRSVTKSRSRTRSRSRTNRKKHLKEGRKSRSRSRSPSVHFREKIRNISSTPKKGSKRARSPSPKRKLSSQIIVSHISPNKRIQPRQKSRSPAIVQEANYALSQEIFSIIEKLQEAKTETPALSTPANSDATSVSKTINTSTKDVTPTVVTKIETEIVKKASTNIVANYSSDLEEISDEEMTLAEDCLEESDQTETKKEAQSTLNDIPKEDLNDAQQSCFGLLPLPVPSVSTEDEKIVKDLQGDDANAIYNRTTIKKDCSDNLDTKLSVFWNLNCSCCGAKQTGGPTEDAQHYDEGECKKKSGWLKQGLPLICAYCSQSGSHWVAACPLLASFCFTCWTWGHNTDTHKENEGEKYIIKLLACYNRFRLNHLANIGRSEQYKVFPSNSKVDGVWKFTGTKEDVEMVSKKIPGHMGKPVGWLVRDNWEKIRGLEIKKETL